MHEPTQETFSPVAGILAILFPGAGHLYLKEPKRAIYAAAGVLWLFLGGIFIGGIDVIDSREDDKWFLGQACVGPLAFGVDWYHQNHLKVRETIPGRGQRLRSAYPNEGRDPKTGAPVPGGIPPNRKSVTKMNELGTLSATLAGMINVIVIIDAAFPTRRRRPAEGAVKS
jgi:hypothetical protein